MKVGDLVKCLHHIGGIVKMVSPGDGPNERYWLVLWNHDGGTLDTLNERMLEVINESRRSG